MDRNLGTHVRSLSFAVALRKESVDRNAGVKMCAAVRAGSLSARRAWIEIFYRPAKPAPPRVALRKESVDRNDAVQIVIVIVRVALRKESVDRNADPVLNA